VPHQRRGRRRPDDLPTDKRGPACALSQTHTHTRTHTHTQQQRTSNQHTDRAATRSRRARFDEMERANGIGKTGQVGARRREQRPDLMEGQ
jgi:hypothetical protein